MSNKRQFKPANDEYPCNIVGLLNACTLTKDLSKGSKLHAYICEHKLLGRNCYIGSSLVNMYAKCGALSKAQQVLRELPVQNVVAWNSLIAGYIQQGQGDEVIKCYDAMLREGRSPTAVTFACVLKACGKINDAAKGKEIHDKIISLGMLDKDIVLGTSLMEMYMKCGALNKAQQVHDELPFHDAISWSALIAGYTQQGQGEQAMKCFDDMLHEGHSPTAITFACVLKACGCIRAAVKGEEIHDKVVRLGMLGDDSVLGTTLVDMYVKCGALAKARQVHEELPVHDVLSWTALIAGYVQQGQGERALKCFDDMLHEGHFPIVVTFVCVLKACGSISAAAKGEEIHDMILSLGMLEKDIILGNSLVDMYTKCGALTKAQRVLKELPIRNEVSWSTLIAGYALKVQGEEALKCFSDMVHEGHSPDAITFISVLKACGSIRLATKGEEIHDKIASLGMLENDIVLGNTLMGMYVKCGALAKAQQVHEELCVRDTVSWSALISGYAQHGQGEAALKCFDDMLFEGHSPTIVTFASALNACGSIGAAAKGEEIHGRIVSLRLLEKDIMLMNSLVDMYAKCGALAKAQQIHEELLVRDVISWSALIAGYVQQGQGQAALKCFDDMLHEGHSPTEVTFACVLKACGSIGAAGKGKEIHDKIARMGLLEENIVLGNALVDMYVKCGELTKAQQVLDELRVRNVVSWNVLIAGYAQQGLGEEALKCFSDMLHEGHSPTADTFICLSKACGSVGAAAKGVEIHDKIVNLNMLELDIVLGNSLVDMYVKCGALSKAQQLFRDLPVQDVVTWNSLIAGYAEQGQGEEALKCFDDMLHEGHFPTAVTFVCALKACGNSREVAKGKEIHDKIDSLGLLEKNILLGNNLVDMYAKCGALVMAHQVLEELPVRNVVSWTALIAGYAQQGQGEKALKCFDNMLHEGHSPTGIAFISVLKACGSIGVSTKGEEIHEKIVRLGMLDKDITLGNSLVDMYVKLGAVAKAQQVIEELSIRDVVSWSALIAGYGQQGQVEEAINCFERMLSYGVKPNSITLTSIINAYSHSGLLSQAGSYFSGMSTKYGIQLNAEHFWCMTDLFCRAGKFNMALSVIAGMPSDRSLSSWVALLGACRKWGEVKIGQLAFEHALDSDKRNTAAYVLMADIYRATGMQERAERIELMRVASKTWKSPDDVGGPLQLEHFILSYSGM